MSRTRYKAVYLLFPEAAELIYGPQERADIADRVEVIEPLLTPEDCLMPGRSWPDIEIIFSGWEMAAVNDDFLQRFPRLQIIFYGAGTIQYFTTPALWRRGIRVTTAAIANAIPVSEFTLSQILFALKQGWQQVLFTQSHGHFPESRMIGAGGYRSTVGLISLGMIGRRVIELLQTFDLSVIAYDPYVTSELAKQWNVEMVSLEELFSRSDVISCHAPGIKATQKMIQGRHFQAMKSGSTFINTARGSVVDEEGMIEVLERRPDLIAVLDVTHPEPPAEGSPLYSLKNVILTPHMAGSIGPECRRMGRTMVEELDRFLAGQPLRYEVNEAQASKLA